MADRGYCKLGDIEACEAAGVAPCVSKPRRTLGDVAGRSPKSAFHYDKATDPHVCTAGERLSTTDASRVGNTPLTHDVNDQGCWTCTMRERRATARCRAIACYVNEAVVDRMAKRLARYPDIPKRQVTYRVNRHEDPALYGAEQTVTVLAVIPATVPGYGSAIVEEGAQSVDEIESAMAETVSPLASSQWNCICLAPGD